VDADLATPNGAAPDMDELLQRFPALYTSLKKVAARVLAVRLRMPAAALSPTELLHDAYLALHDEAQSGKPRAGPVREHFSDSHFRACVGAACKDALIAHLRRAGRKKRGGGRDPESLNSQIAVAGEQYQVLAIEEAIDLVRTKNSDLATLLDLRLFAELTIEQCAEAQNIPLSKCKRRWSLAKAMLKQIIER
jgi:DNA-directed RNA polymerase specialized sigma24 family protein